MGLKMSVIIPMYNSGNLVSETLDSLVNQSIDKSEFEVLVIDDGSKDNGAEVCAEYVEKYDNFHYYYKDNSGVSDTRNFGFKKAKGKYLLPLDADDLLDKDTIKLIIDFFDKHYDEIDICCYNDILFYDDGTKREREIYKKRFNRGTDVYDVDGEDYYSIHTNMQVVVKNDGKNYYDTRYYFGEDELFNTLTVMKKKKIGYVKEAIHYYRRHNASVTATSSQKNFDKIYEGFYESLVEKFGPHPYIQSTIFHNVSWRMNENYLKDSDLINIRKNLQHVDFSKYAHSQLCQMSTFYSIVALSGRKGRIKNGKYYIDGQEIECDISSYIFVDEIKVDDKINLELTINIPYFQENDVNINCNYIVNGEKKSMKIKQVPFSKYVDRFRKKVFVELPKETTKISFSAKGIDKFKIEGRSLVAYVRVYKDKNITIKEDCLLVENRKKFTKLKNKFKACKGIKMLALLLMSFFVPKKNIYIGYNDMLNEQCAKDKKGYKIDKFGFKERLLILHANKAYFGERRNLMPFGGSNKLYIQGGQFECEVVKKY